MSIIRGFKDSLRAILFSSPLLSSPHLTSPRNNTTPTQGHKKDRREMLQALQAARKQREEDNGFSWIVEGKLGGMRMPQVESELAAILQKYKIGLVVSLTEQPIQCVTNTNEVISKVVFSHSPISDFTSPSVAQANAIVETMDRAISSGQAVVVHCHAGMGRTGTIIACYLVSKGHMSAVEAVELTRKKRPGSIVKSQEDFIVTEFTPSLSQNNLPPK